MLSHSVDLASRRRLLQFLAASPLFAHPALAQGFWKFALRLRRLVDVSSRTSTVATATAD